MPGNPAYKADSTQAVFDRHPPTFRQSFFCIPCPVPLLEAAQKLLYIKKYHISCMYMYFFFAMMIYFIILKKKYSSVFLSNPLHIQYVICIYIFF